MLYSSNDFVSLWRMGSTLGLTGESGPAQGSSANRLSESQTMTAWPFLPVLLP